MVFKYLNLKYIVLTLVIFIILYSLVAFLLYGNLGDNNKSLDLLSSPVQMVFGKSNKNDNKIEVQLDEIGVALALFPTSQFDTKDYSQLELTVSNLPKNYHVKLVVISKQNPTPLELPLMQPDGGMQSNLLIYDKNWTGNIDQIGLRFLPQDELGLSIPMQDSIIVNSAVLNNKGYFQNYFTLFDYWLEYEPWAYLSISHLKASKILTIYAQPVVFVMLWIIICLLFYLIFFKRRLNLFSIILSWLLLDMLFIHNMNANKNWAQAIYGSDLKTLPDDELYNMSINIKKLFGSKEDLLEMKKNKMYILTLSKYNGLRLVYHLLPLNVGFWGTQLPGSEFKIGDYILSYGYPDERIEPIHGVLHQNGISVNVKQISSGENFNLLKVVN